jgi:hypothetical protein
MSSGGVSLPNGPASAAIVAAGVGCCALGVLAVVGDGSKSVAKLLTFYLQTGPLSGVTTVAIVIWLATWVVLARLWRNKTVAAGKASTVALVLLVVGLLLTFPPVGDLVLGK